MVPSPQGPTAAAVALTVRAAPVSSAGGPRPLGGRVHILWTVVAR